MAARTSPSRRVAILLSRNAGSLGGAGRDQRRGAERLDCARRGRYELDARLDLSLPGGARRAIDAGLTLRLNYQTEIGRVRRYLPDPEVASLVQSFELSYHALSQRYLVRNLNTGEQFDHGSLDGALERVAEVRLDCPLIDSSLLEPGPTYEFRVRAEIDMRTTPDALNWLLFWADDWSATSEWYAWTLHP